MTELPRRIRGSLLAALGLVAMAGSQLPSAAQSKPLKKEREGRVSKSRTVTTRNTHHIQVLKPKKGVDYKVKVLKPKPNVDYKIPRFPIQRSETDRKSTESDLHFTALMENQQWSEGFIGLQDNTTGHITDLDPKLFDRLQQKNSAVRNASVLAANSGQPFVLVTVTRPVWKSGSSAMVRVQDYSSTGLFGSSPRTYKMENGKWFRGDTIIACGYWKSLTIAGRQILPPKPRR